MRSLAALVAVTLSWTVARDASAQQQQPAPPTGEELARFRYCTQQAQSSAVETALFAAECAERLSDRIPEAAGILAFRAARAHLAANAIAAAVRWAMRCHERATPNHNVTLADRLRRECAAIVRAHYRSVAWLANGSSRCRWSASERSFVDSPTRYWVSIPANERWIAVESEVTQIQVTCDVPTDSDEGVSAPIGNITATLVAGRRYHLAATITVRPE